jgi:hypothetical protein
MIIERHLQDFSCPSEFYGCGQFVASSWRIFCRGDHSGQGVADPTLRHYLAWLRKPPAEEGEERPAKMVKADTKQGAAKRKAKKPVDATSKRDTKSPGPMRQTRSRSMTTLKGRTKA